MGLDNGIMVAPTSNCEAMKALACFRKDMSGYEICYWRRCWNVRGDILNIIGGFTDERSPVSLEHIDPIIKLLKSYNEQNWDLSRFEYEEIRPQLEEQIKALQKLKKIMEKYDLTVYFYDSR